MKARIKKKFQKRNGYRHYIDYIRDLLVASVLSHVEPDLDVIPYFVFSKNGKHIVHVYILKNASLVATPGMQVVETSEITMDFTCRLGTPKNTESLSEVTEMLRNWMKKNMVNEMENSYYEQSKQIKNIEE